MVETRKEHQVQRHPCRGESPTMVRSSMRSHVNYALSRSQWNACRWCMQGNTARETGSVCVGVIFCAWSFFKISTPAATQRGELIFFVAPSNKYPVVPIIFEVVIYCPSNYSFHWHCLPDRTCGRCRRRRRRRFRATASPRTSGMLSP